MIGLARCGGVRAHCTVMIEGRNSEEGGWVHHPLGLANITKVNIRSSQSKKEDGTVNWHETCIY